MQLGRAGREPSSPQSAGLAKVVESVHAQVLSALSEVILDAEKLVVLSNTLGTSRCTSLDLTSVGCNNKVSNGGVLGLTGTVGNNCGVTCALSHLDSLEGLGQGTNLVDLDEDGVTSVNLNALLQALSVGNKEVVADELDLLAQTLGKDLPTVPVLLCKAVLDGDDWELLDHFLVVRR